MYFRPGQSDAKYEEAVLTLPQDIPLDQIKIMGNFTTYDHYTTGKLKTTFRFDSPNAQKQASCDIAVGEMRIQTLKLSPLGLTLWGMQASNSNDETLDIKLVCSDATQLTLDSRMKNSEQDSFKLKCTFEMPIDITNITAAVINGQIVALQ